MERRRGYCEVGVAGVPHNAPGLAEKRVEGRERSSGWDCRGKASDADDFGGVVAVDLMRRLDGN